eukprot:11259269-Ditylum_brightwellii.AAC.1
MDALEMLGVIQYHDARIKKVRFVVGGHIIDSSKHTTYSSMIKDISVRLMMLAAAKCGLGMLSGDIGNVFCKTPCAEKIWSVAGEQFGDKKRAIVVLKQDLNHPGQIKIYGSRNLTTMNAMTI